MAVKYLTIVFYGISRSKNCRCQRQFDFNEQMANCDIFELLVSGRNYPFKLKRREFIEAENTMRIIVEPFFPAIGTAIADAQDDPHWQVDHDFT